jgi:DNA replication initiation complex subunit (GINS family)
MTTYSDLERIYRLEKNSPTMQSIPEDFYAQALKLSETPEAAEHRENILELLNEIYERRRSKIILHAARTAGNPTEPSNALKKEAELYYNIISIVESNRRMMLEQKTGEDESSEVDVSKKRIRLLQAIPVIIGVDAAEYGPFRADDIVELPVDNAQILVERGVAEEI